MMIPLLWVAVCCLVVGSTNSEDSGIEDVPQTTTRNIPHGFPRSLFPSESANTGSAEHGPGSKIAYHIKIQKSDKKTGTGEVRHVNLTFTNKKDGTPFHNAENTLISNENRSSLHYNHSDKNSNNPTIYILSNFLNQLRSNQANISVTGPVVHLKRLDGSEESHSIKLSDLSYPRDFTPSDQTVSTSGLFSGSTDRATQTVTLGKDLTQSLRVEATTFRPNQGYFSSKTPIYNFHSSQNNDQNHPWSPITDPVAFLPVNPEVQQRVDPQYLSQNLKYTLGETSPKFDSLETDYKRFPNSDASSSSPDYYPVLVSDSSRSDQLSGAQHGYDKVRSLVEASTESHPRTIDNSGKVNSPSDSFEKEGSPQKTSAEGASVDPSGSLYETRTKYEEPNINTPISRVQLSSNITREDFNERPLENSGQIKSLYSTEYVQPLREEIVDGFDRFNTHFDQLENITVQRNVSDVHIYSGITQPGGTGTLRPELFTDYINEIYSTVSDFTDSYGGQKSDNTEFWDRPTETTFLPERSTDYIPEVSSFNSVTDRNVVHQDGLTERAVHRGHFDEPKEDPSTSPLSNGRLYLRLEDILGGVNNYGNKESLSEHFLAPYNEDSKASSNLDVDFLADSEKIDLFNHGLSSFEDTNKIKRKLESQPGVVIPDSFISTPGLMLFSSEGESDALPKKKKSKKLLSRVLIDVPTFTTNKVEQIYGQGEEDFPDQVPNIFEDAFVSNGKSFTTDVGVSPGQDQYSRESLTSDSQGQNVIPNAPEEQKPEHVTPCLHDDVTTPGSSHGQRAVEEVDVTADTRLQRANNQPIFIGGIPESRASEKILVDQVIDKPSDLQRDEDQLHKNKFRAERRKDTWLDSDEQEVEESEHYGDTSQEGCSSDFISQIKSVLGTKYYESLLTLIKTAKNSDRKSREVQLYNQNSVLSLDKYASDESKHVKQNIELLLNRLGYTLTGAGGKVSLKPISDLSEDLTQSILQSNSQEADPNKKFVVLISSLDKNAINSAAKGHYTLTRLGDLGVNGNSVSLPLETLSQGSLEDIQSKGKILESGIPASVAETILKSFAPPNQKREGASDDSLSESNVQIIQINPKDNSPLSSKLEVPETGDPEVKSTIYSILEGITSGKLRASSDAPLILASESDYDNFFSDKSTNNENARSLGKAFPGDLESVAKAGLTGDFLTRPVNTKSSFDESKDKPNTQPPQEPVFTLTTVFPPLSSVDFDTGLYGVTPDVTFSSPSGETDLFELDPKKTSLEITKESDIEALLSPESRELLGSKNLVPVIRTGDNFLVPSEYLSSIKSLASESAQLHPQTQLSGEGFANISPLLSYAINNYAKPELSRDFASSIEKYMKNLPRTKDKYTTIDLSDKRPAVPHVRPHGSGEPPENIPQTISINDFADVLRHQTKLSGGQLILEKVSVIPKGSTKPVSLIQASITPSRQEFPATTPVSISKPPSLIFETNDAVRLPQKPVSDALHVTNKPLYTVKPKLSPASGSFENPAGPPKRLQTSDQRLPNRPTIQNSQPILSLPSVGNLNNASVQEIPELASVYSEDDQLKSIQQNAWQPSQHQGDLSTTYGGQVHNSPSKFKFSDNSAASNPGYFDRNPERNTESSIFPSSSLRPNSNLKKAFFPQDKLYPTETNLGSAEETPSKVRYQSSDSQSINLNANQPTERYHSSQPSSSPGASQWRPLASFDQSPGKFVNPITPKSIPSTIRPEKLYNTVDTSTHSNVVTDVHQDANGGPIGSVSYSTSHGNAGRSTFRISFGGSSKSPGQSSASLPTQGVLRDAFFPDTPELKSDRDGHEFPGNNHRRPSNVLKASVLPNDAEISQVKHFQTRKSSPDVSRDRLEAHDEHLTASHSVGGTRPNSRRPLQRTGPPAQINRDPKPYAYLTDFNSEKTSLDHGPLHASPSDNLFVDTVSGDGLITSLSGAGTSSARKGRTFNGGGQFVNRYKLNLGEDAYLSVVHKSSADGTSITYSRD